MTNAIQKLSQLQEELGYQSNCEISPVALLGIVGEAGEVLAETLLLNSDLMPVDVELLSTAENVAVLVDNLKKKVRRHPEANYSVQIINDEHNDFDMEMADLLYYFNIIARNRGLSIDHYADLATKKVREKLSKKSKNG